jgi:hypothetical protein
LLQAIKNILPTERTGAFVDDLVIIAKRVEELEQVVKTIEQWADQNRC